jgi:hypothetical protein
VSGRKSTRSHSQHPARLSAARKDIPEEREGTPGFDPIVGGGG